MTTTLVKAEIARFLKFPVPEVMCIKGKWGVGKTFSWQQFLRQAASSDSIGLGHYAYISLFGLNSLEALKNAILENSVPSKKISNGPSLEEYKAFVKGNGVLGLASFFGKKDIGELLTRAMFLSLKKRIVCIDDLERVGSALELRDVLGLASMLKEERECKVVLLLNDEQLTGENKADFNRLLEKVVDVSLVFDPTPQEAAEIAFSDGSTTSKFLRPKVLHLGITNIRIIKKIERLANRIFEILSDFRVEILEQAMSTVTLGAWSSLDPDVAPPISYVKLYNRDIEAMRAQREIPEEDRNRWNLTIESYGYKHSDNLDFVILEGVERGYFDDQAVIAAAREIENAMANDRMKNSFTQAWDKYHRSLSINDDEILDSLFAGAMQNLHLINPLSLNATVMMLRQNGRNEQATQLVGAYMSARSFPRDALAEELRMWGPEPVDTELEAAFQQIAANFEDTRDPTDVMKKITAHSSWNNEDVDLLSKLTPIDFERIFETVEGDELPRVAKFIVSLGGHEGENYKAMGFAVTEGLKLIAAKSPLKARRVRSYGVDLDTNEAGG
jgi:hypothetical protein